MKKVISSENAPRAIGPYSQAVCVGNMLFVSGQIPIDPQTGCVVEGGVGMQTEQVLRNVEAILEAAGFDFCDVVKTTVFLSDMSMFSEMNETYGRFYDKSTPARSTVAVKGLPLGVFVEIETIAVKSA